MLLLNLENCLELEFVVIGLIQYISFELGMCAYAFAESGKLFELEFAVIEFFQYISLELGNKVFGMEQVLLCLQRELIQDLGNKLQG